ncbi:hypothetical protein DPX16_15249 [Anabarilius grahami]|uniref:Uncharacterized protein n=1 Tax=Anabarilius grahami TaxID=495550 RepID=A0A3N0XWR6_ANAGA|nr:hypothetical protein DPX16_15249 [Anabarilius grahami]
MLHLFFSSLSRISPLNQVHRAIGLLSPSAEFKPQTAFLVNHCSDKEIPLGVGQFADPINLTRSNEEAKCSNITVKCIKMLSGLSAAEFSRLGIFIMGVLSIFRKPITTSECSGQASTELCHRKTSVSPGQDGKRTGEKELLKLRPLRPSAAAEKDPVPEPAAWVLLEPKQAAQSITEPEADHCLIDLWSVDSVPTRVPTLESSLFTPVLSGHLDALVLSSYLDAPVPSRNLPPPISLPDFLVPSPPLVLSSSLYPSEPLVSSFSSALPPPLAPSGSLALPRASCLPA